ncbi:MAG: MFS transporter [Parvibaculaceae bacterium]|nr:MFS transporter [Parvibaculaceae bacterium]
MNADELIPDWAAIGAVILGVTAFAVAQGLTYPLISLVLEQKGVPASLIGLNAMGFAVGLAIATLLVGRLTVFIRGDKLIIGALVGCSLCLASFSIFDSVWIWSVIRVLLGFCASLIFMLSEAWLNSSCPDRLRGRVSGLYGAGMCAGFAAGPLAIPLFGTQHGFAFASLAVYLALVAFVTAVLGLRTRTKPEPAAAAGALFGFIRGAPLLIATVVAFGISDIAAVSGMPVYFLKTGHSPAFAAVSVTFMALPTALAQPFVGLLLDRVSRPFVAIIASFMAAASFLAIPFLPSETAILASFALLGAASFALYTCALTLLGEGYKGSVLVTGSAVFALAYAIGSATGSGVTGVAMDIFPPSAGPLGVGAILTLFTVVLIFGRHTLVRVK